MAAPLLHVRVPADVPPPPPDEAAGGGGGAPNGHAPHAGGAESGSESSSGLDTPRGAGGALGRAAGGVQGKEGCRRALVRCVVSALRWRAPDLQWLRGPITRTAVRLQAGCTCAKLALGPELHTVRQ
jgi:hypothetical protein